jgi:hypothetical protein
MIRFWFGSREHPASFVWRLWTQGNEIYLEHAPGGSPKLSL